MIHRSTGRWKKKLSHKALRISKEVRQFARDPLNARPSFPQLLFILGCQRSGTTMMTRIFEKDLDAKVYPEHSVLSDQDDLDGLRLNPLSEVAHHLKSERYPLVVLKPLVETQNGIKLLDFFDGSRGLWMFRHYADVAHSNLNRFGIGNGIKNLRFIAQKDPTNWRSEKVSPSLRDLISRHFSEEMNPYDAAALFWYIRNTYFFELGLADDSRIRMVRYSDLTANPTEIVKQIYQHVGLPFPGPQLVRDVHSHSVGKGKEIDLSPAIRTLCESMLDRLVQQYEAQSLAPASVMARVD